MNPRWAVTVLLAASVIGCGLAGHRGAGERSGSTRGRTPTAIRPVSEGSRSADVIRTRIAWKERRASGAPSTEPHPTIQVQVGGDGVMRAPDLGLAWNQRPAGLFDLEDARAYCGGLVVAGVSAWRLPEIWELETIVRADGALCGGGQPLKLWSGTPQEDRGVQIWDCGGQRRSHHPVGMAHVVCVGRIDG